MLKRHLLAQVQVSAVYDELGLQPAMFYRWQKDWFEIAAAAFQPKARTLHQAQQERIAYLEQKIQRKDEAERPYRVLAELMAEHLALKKSLGEL